MRRRWSHTSRRGASQPPSLARSWAVHHEVQPPERERDGRDYADDGENRHTDEVDDDGDNDSRRERAADVLLKDLLGEATTCHVSGGEDESGRGSGVGSVPSSGGGVGGVPSSGGGVGGVPSSGGGDGSGTRPGSSIVFMSRPYPGAVSHNRPGRREHRQPVAVLRCVRRALDPTPVSSFRDPLRRTPLRVMRGVMEPTISSGDAPAVRRVGCRSRNAGNPLRGGEEVDSGERTPAHVSVRRLQTVASACHRLPPRAHGKEGVNGSSPLEGSTKALLSGAFLFGHPRRMANLLGYGAFSGDEPVTRFPAPRGPPRSTRLRRDPDAANSLRSKRTSPSSDRRIAIRWSWAAPELHATLPRPASGVPPASALGPAPGTGRASPDAGRRRSAGRCACAGAEPSCRGGCSSA